MNPDDIRFAVSLLDIGTGRITPKEAADLAINAIPVGKTGRYWLFEGDEEALEIRRVKVLSEGATGFTGEMWGDALLLHCAEIFNVDVGMFDPDCGGT